MNIISGHGTIGGSYLVPDAVVDRRAEAGAGRVWTDVPCCDLSLELPAVVGVVKQAGCPRCALAYTVELVGAEGALWARFTVVGPIAIASAREAPMEGLSWHAVGERTHLVALDNVIIGVVSREGGVFTARQDGVNGRLPQIYESVAAARAVGDAYRAPVSIWF